MPATTRARILRSVVSVWAAKNSTSPAIIPINPTTSLPLLRPCLSFRRCQPQYVIPGWPERARPGISSLGRTQANQEIPGSRVNRAPRNDGSLSLVLRRRVAEIAIVDKAHHQGTAGQRAAEAVAEFHRQAGIERVVDGLQIRAAVVRRGAGRGKGQTRRSDQFARTLEAEAHRHLHALARLVGGRRRPARAQFGEQIADGVEIVVRAFVLGLILLRRDRLDGELEVLAIGIVDLGNARPVMEHAAEIRRAGAVIEHAAGGMGERDRVDVMIVPRNRVGRDDDRGKDGQTNGDALQHANRTFERKTLVQIDLIAESAGIKAKSFTSASLIGATSTLTLSSWSSRRRPGPIPRNFSVAFGGRRSSLQ